VRAVGIHTALDTNGSLGERLSDQELEHIDLVLLDIKTWDPERHMKLTGHDVGPTLAFARRLAARNRPVWLRFVLVPGLTEDVSDITQIAKFAAALGNIARVQVLPFHQMGKYKWKELGLDYTLENVAPPSSHLIERTCAVFRAEGLVAY
jgi:pyruvate formate lyase activating enzyme